MAAKYYTALVLFVWLLSSCAVDAPIYTGKHTCNTTTPVHDTIVLLVLGQSNAANAGEVKYQSHCTNTFNFYAGNYYALNDPLYGSNGTGGSVWGRLADKLIERNFAGTVIVAPCAVGGTRIEQWIPGGNLNYLLDETINSLDSAGLKVTHVLWHQGESNHVLYSGGLSAQENARAYTANFHTLVSYLRSSGIEVPIYPAIATYCIRQPDTVLQQAQRNLANDTLKIYNGPDTDLLGREYRYDNCHFNEEGLDKHAELWRAVLMR